eukprot:PITA_31691
MDSIFLVLSLVSSFKWEVHQMDVKFSFLHGDLHEEIYMEQPPGFMQTDSSIVCQLNKSLYGLKQAPRAWYAKMDSFLLDNGFSRCHSDNNVYTKKVGKSLIILIIYVYDLILTSSDANLINDVKSSLKKKFEMTNLGHLHYFLGLQVLQTKEEASPLLVGFTDFDWAGDPHDQKSTTGYVFTLGSGPITEAEYHGTVEASKEALWLHQILSEFGFQQQHRTTLLCDSQSAIQL